MTLSDPTGWLRRRPLHKSPDPTTLTVAAECPADGTLLTVLRSTTLG